MKSWYRSLTRFERISLILCAVVIPIYQVFKAICHATSYGDFNVHRDFGARFLAGVPLYRGGMCFNYMPVSALSYAPLAWFPEWLASLLRTSTALAALFLTLRWLGAMVSDRARPGSWRGVAVGSLTVLLALQYIFRDLDDGGPHLLYLGLLVGAMYADRTGREGLGALGFGLAVALKMSPGLLLPFFAWKRRWRLAGLSTLATIGWIVLPAAWMGPSSWWAHQQQWNRLGLSVFADRLDPERVANEVRVQNQALKPAVVRLLVAYPAGHPLKVDHPADRAFLDLDPATANRLGSLAVLGLLAGVAWWSRRPSAGPDDPAWPAEMAAVILLMPLLSPVTWLQHLVFVIPAVYLIVAEHRSFRPLGRLGLGALGLYAVLAVLLSRQVVGRTNSLALLSLHTHTLAMLLLLGLLMARRPTARVAPVEAGPPRPMGLRPGPAGLASRVAGASGGLSGGL